MRLLSEPVNSKTPGFVTPSMPSASSAPSSTPSEPYLPAPGSDPLELARKAREHSRSGFLSAVETNMRVRQEVDGVRAHHRQNHYGEGLDKLFRGHP